MISWNRIYLKLKDYCPSEKQGSLEEVFHYLYIDQSWSLDKLAEATDRGARAQAIRNKLKKIGIEIRNKGGDQRSLHLGLSLKDFENYSAIELARMHNVHVSTIYIKKQELENETRCHTYDS